MKEIFDQILKKGEWNSAGTICGNGSTMDYTENLRQHLSGLLQTYSIKSMFDAPCGDYSWMSKIELPNGVQYIGGDIVEFLIEQNRQQYPGVDFRVFDIAQDNFPDVDLLFCRDCLIHFSHEDIIKTLKNIARSNIKYVLMTNYYEVANSDIPTGSFRGVNFYQQPYGFEPAIDSIEDWVPGYEKRRLCLWKVKTISEFLETIQEPQ